MSEQDIIRNSILASIETKQNLLNSQVPTVIEKVANCIERSIRSGGKVLLCGNGGSAADSQHIAAEFVSRFMFDRPAMAAIALTTDTSALTAIGNDYGFEKLFERQVEALGSNCDVFIGISTSGNSANVLRAAVAAKAKGMKTVGFAGQGGKIWNEFDYVLRSPSEVTARIQECHILFGHVLCELVERKIWT